MHHCKITETNTKLKNLNKLQYTERQVSEQDLMSSQKTSWQSAKIIK